jgi:hypothetical protein
LKPLLDLHNFENTDASAIPCLITGRTSYRIVEPVHPGKGKASRQTEILYSPGKSRRWLAASLTQPADKALAEHAPKARRDKIRFNAHIS